MTNKFLTDRDGDADAFIDALIASMPEEHRARMEAATEDHPDTVEKGWTRGGKAKTNRRRLIRRLKAKRGKFYRS